MERKKFIKRLAFTAIFFFVGAGVVNIYESLYHISWSDKKTASINASIAKLNEKYQEYLDETAGKITSLAVDRQIISRIQSDILKKKPNSKLYLWMSDAEGNFVFGVPSTVFNRLNKIFDKRSTIFEQEASYVDRNDYLLKVVDSYDEIEPLALEPDELYEGAVVVETHSKSRRFTFSSPILDENKQMIGELYLKVDDSKNPDLHYKFLFAERSDIFKKLIFPLFHVLMGLSGFLLWILVPSWVYIDARQRDEKRAFMWAILTVVSFGFALIVYLITRPATIKSFHCPQCQEELNGTKAFCPYCGMDLSKTFCSQCQYPIKADWQFCPNCRFDLTRAAQEEPAAKEEQEPQEEVKK